MTHEEKAMNDYYNNVCKLSQWKKTSKKEPTSMQLHLYGQL